MFRLVLLVSYLATWVGLGAQPASGWQALSDFGDNPGQLNGYVYVPARAMAHRPLVVAMHGCGQDAASFARLSGWNKLADELGFVVLYPEQRMTNNAQKCFNWFQPADVAVTGGEAASIRQMVAQVGQLYQLDSSRYFATGFSAGGAMTVVLLAAYPELFEAGASVAGIAAGGADDLMSALSLMRGKVSNSASEWASMVEQQHPGYEGEWPQLLVIQGLADSVVRPPNALELVKQWTALHGIDAEKAPIDGGTLDEAPHVSFLRFSNSRGDHPVAWYKLRNWPHAYPVDPGSSSLQGGEIDLWTQDADWHATYWIGRFFKL